jgi:hypothetical protein
MMTHNETHKHHLGLDFVGLGVAVSAIAWTIFVFWTLALKLMEIARN